MNRISAILSRPIDLHWLAMFRALYGLSMACSLLRWIGYGWLDELLLRPMFHFKYWGFAWIEPLSDAAMHRLAWALVGFALATAAGFCFRIAALSFTVGFTYLQLIDVTTYLNHYYLASLLGLLLAIAPAHRVWSIDAWLRPTPRCRRAPVGWLYLFRFQVGVVYTFAGIAKAHADWLLYGFPLKIWLASRSDLPLLGDLIRIPSVPILMSWTGFLFDSTIALWLLWSKTRPYAYAVVIAFHVLTRLLFPIGMFPIIMVLSALLFFPETWPLTLIRRIHWPVPWKRYPNVARDGEAVAEKALRTSPWCTDQSRRGHTHTDEGEQWGTHSGGIRQRCVLMLAALYCTLQFVLPLRCLFYGGNVRWHEQGMRFSWRVMVREKNGSITYVVRQKATGRIWHVSPNRYLSPLQEREISGQPDLILQLAHYIGQEFNRGGFGPVEVRADALVSLNGRKMTRLIDPNVDLIEVHDGLGKATWILAGPVSPPPHVRLL